MDANKIRLQPLLCGDKSGGVAEREWGDMEGPSDGDHTAESRVAQRAATSGKDAVFQAEDAACKGPRAGGRL